MAFPSSPSNGQSATVNGIVYNYASATNSWVRKSSPLANLSVTNTITSGGNIVAAATTVSTTATTGALVVKGGVGVAGNVYADRLYTATGMFWAGNGAVISTGGAGTFTYTAGTSPPGSPVDGDFWYKTTTDILFQWVNDGTTSYWVDVQTPAFSANTPVSTQAIGWGMSAVFGG